MVSRTSYHHGALREALLDAGDDVLREHGLQGFTLRECARRAGVSHAAPKHHFGDVAGFLTALAARGYVTLLDILREALRRAGDGLDARFEATSRAYYEFAERWPEHFRIMFRCDLLDRYDPELRNAAMATYAELTNVVLAHRGDAAITAGELPETVSNAEVMNDIMIAWCFIHGYAHLRIEQQFDMVAESLQNEVLRRASERISMMLSAR